jgi:hypothetical protein
VHSPWQSCRTPISAESAPTTLRARCGSPQISGQKWPWNRRSRAFHRGVTRRALPRPPQHHQRSVAQTCAPTDLAGTILALFALCRPGYPGQGARGTAVETARTRLDPSAPVQPPERRARSRRAGTVTGSPEIRGPEPRGRRSGTGTTPRACGGDPMSASPTRCSTGQTGRPRGTPPSPADVAGARDTLLPTPALSSARGI